MKKQEDTEPENKNSREYFEWLKRENIRQLRKAGHKANNLGNEPRKRNKFAKLDDSRIKVIKTKEKYWDWMERKQMVNEPLEANPDLFEDGVDETVD